MKRLMISAFAAVALLAAATITLWPDFGRRWCRIRSHDVVAGLNAATEVNKLPIEEFGDQSRIGT